MDYAEITICRARGLLARDATRAVAPLCAQSTEIFVVVRAVDLHGDHRTEAELMASGEMSPRDVMKRRIAKECDPNADNPTLEVFRTPKTEQAVNPTFNQKVTKFHVPVDQFPICFDVWAAPFVTLDDVTPYVGSSFLDDEDDRNTNPDFQKRVPETRRRFSNSSLASDDFFTESVNININNPAKTTTTAKSTSKKRELFLGRGTLTESDFRSAFTQRSSLLDKELRIELRPRPDEDDQVVEDAALSMPTGLGILVVDAKLLRDFVPPPTKEELAAAMHRERDFHSASSAGANKLIPITIPTLDILSPKSKKELLGNRALPPKPSIDGVDNDDEMRCGVSYALHPAQMLEISIQNCPAVIDAWLSERRATHQLNFPGAPLPANPQRFEIIVETFNGTIFSSGPIATATVFEFQKIRNERDAGYMGRRTSTSLLANDDDDDDDSDSESDDDYSVNKKKKATNKFQNNNDNNNIRARADVAPTTFALFSIFGSICAPIGSELPFKIRFIDCNKRLRKLEEKQEAQQQLASGSSSTSIVHTSQSANEFSRMQALSINFPHHNLTGNARASGGTSTKTDEPDMDEDGKPLFLRDVFAESTNSAKLYVPHPEHHSMSAEAVNNLTVPHPSAHNQQHTTAIPVRLVDRESAATRNSFFGARYTVDVRIKPVLFVPAKSVSESHLFRGKGLLKIEVREVRDLVCSTLSSYISKMNELKQKEAERRSGVRADRFFGRKSPEGGGNNNNDDDDDDERMSAVSGRTNGTNVSKATRTTITTTGRYGSLNFNINNKNGGSGRQSTASGTFLGGNALNANQNNNNNNNNNNNIIITPAPPKPEPIYCEVAVKDGINDKNMKVLGRSPIVMPEEDAFFGFTTTVELEQINQLPEVIIISIYQGQASTSAGQGGSHYDLVPTCIARSVVRILDRRSIDGTWVTLTPPVNKKTGQETSEGLKGMAWVRWVASCRDTTTAAEMERERAMALGRNPQHEADFFDNSKTSLWITKDTLVPDLLKSSNVAAMGNTTGNLRNACQLLKNFDHEQEFAKIDLLKKQQVKEQKERNRLMALTNISFANITNSFSPQHHQHQNQELSLFMPQTAVKLRRRKHYEEAGALAIDWNCVPIGYALKISQKGRTLFGPCIRVNTSLGGHIRNPPLVVYIDTPQEAPILFECFRGPEFGSPLVVFQKDRIYYKKCWLPVDAPMTEQQRLQERVIDEHDSDEEEERKRRAERKKKSQHPPCFTVALDEIAAIRVPCRWVPLYKRFPPRRDGGDDDSDDDDEDEWGRKRKRGRNLHLVGADAEDDEARRRREQEEEDERLRNKKKPPMKLRIIGPVFPALDCKLDDEEDTLEKIQPLVERHFGIERHNHIFYQGKMKVMATGRPQVPAAPNNPNKALVGMTASMRVRIKKEEDTFDAALLVIELTLANRDARAQYLTAKLPGDSCGGIVVPIAVPAACTVGTLRDLLREAIVHRKLTHPATGEFLYDLWNFEKARRQQEEQEQRERARLEKIQKDKEKAEEEERKKKEEQEQREKEKEKDGGAGGASSPKKKVTYNISELFKKKEKKVKEETEEERKLREHKERETLPPPPLSDVHFVVQRLIHFNKILQDETTVRNLGLRIETPIVAVFANPDEMINNNNSRQIGSSQDDNTAKNLSRGRRISRSPSPALKLSFNEKENQNGKSNAVVIPPLALMEKNAALGNNNGRAERRRSIPMFINNNNNKGPRINFSTQHESDELALSKNSNPNQKQTTSSVEDVHARKNSATTIAFNRIYRKDNRNNNNKSPEPRKPSPEPNGEVSGVIVDQELISLQQDVRVANARVMELENTVKRQQELLKRVASSMPK